MLRSKGWSRSNGARAAHDEAACLYAELRWSGLLEALASAFAG